jgi:hypothetical protein
MPKNGVLVFTSSERLRFSYELSVFSHETTSERPFHGELSEVGMGHRSGASVPFEHLL